MNLQEKLEQIRNDFENNIVLSLKDSVKELCDKYPLIANIEIAVEFNAFDDTSNYNSINYDSPLINYLNKEQYIKSLGNIGRLYLKNESLLEAQEYSYKEYEENKENMDKEILDISEQIESHNDKAKLTLIIEMFNEVSSTVATFAKELIIKDIICMHFSSNSSIVFDTESDNLI